MTTSYRKFISSEVKESIFVKEKFLEKSCGVLEKIINVSIGALRKNRTLFFLGNGGSAADAQHIASELVGRYRYNHAPLKAVSLATNSSVLTAVSNDFSFENVFVRQVSAYVEKGDVVFLLSTSGKSKNVLLACVEARRKGAVTIGFTGTRGKEFAKMVDIALIVPSDNVARAQECHLLAGHIICYAIEKVFRE